MTQYLSYVILAFLLGLGASGVTIPLIVAFCRKYGYYDQPNLRKVHHVAVPRLGGVAFLPSLAVACATTMLLYYSRTQDFNGFHTSAAIMVLGAAIIYVVGLLDDVLDLPAMTKFIILLFASACVPLCNLVIGSLHGFFGIYDLPLWVAYPLTVMVIMVVVNALNLIDGIDGLASGIAIILLGLLTYLFIDLRSIVFAVLSSGLLGSVMMFFIFNVFGRVGKMKIFMGDAGSLILGYVLAYLSIKYMLVTEKDIYTDTNPMLIPFSMFIVPVFDLVRVALTRVLAGQPMFRADKRHIHHVLMSAGLTMHQTLFAILGLVVGFIALNVALYHWCGVPLTVIFLLDVTLFILFFVVVYSFVPRQTDEA